MIDIQIVRDNPELVKTKSKQKGYEVDIEVLLQIDEKRRDLQQKVESLRAERNVLAASAKGQKPNEEQVAKGKQLKEELAKLDDELLIVENKFLELINKVPNMPLDEVPVGSSEDENKIVSSVGDKPEFDFDPKSDAELGLQNETIDKERATKVAGTRFAYIKGGLVNLQFAIIQLVFDTLSDETVVAKLIKDNNLKIEPKAFVPVLPPAMVKTVPYVASGRLDAQEVTYKLADDEVWMNASAEHSLCTMYMNEILDEAQLPIRYVGYATSFRREAGSYGKDAEGIFRMHQFDKIEMEVFSTADTGLDEHKLLVAVQEYLVNMLGLPYQLIQKCTADIGGPNAQGVDINTWMPAQNQYRETHTADYMTDYQARSLQTRVRRSDGSLQFVHTNDATAFALGRIMKAIMENYQTSEGKIRVPKALQKFMNGKETI